MHFQRRGIMNYSYSVGDIVGRGFSSIVYKGINDLTQEEVAIKVIQRQISDQIPLIQNEITVLSKLKGNFILKLHDYFYTKNNIYIITELCKQGDLQSYIKKYGKLNSNIAIQIIIQIIYGIVSMQQENIIHRDLKPQNILISDNTIRIADFGFAKEMSKLSSEMNVGTPLYMSPETLIRNQYHLKSDIWSFGVMAYEILFGIPPWSAQNERDLIYEITRNQVTFPDAPEIPSHVKQLIQNCLVFDVNYRSSIADILNNKLFVKQQNKTTFKTVKVDRLAAPVIPKITKNDSDQFIIVDNTIQGYQNYFSVIKFILSDNYKLISPWLKEKLCILSAKHLTILSAALYNLFTSESNTGDNKIRQQGLEQVCQDNIKIQELFQSQLIKVSSIPEFSNDNVKFDQEFSRLIKNLTKEGLLSYIKMSIEELNHDLYTKIKLQNVIQYTKELQILKTLSQYYELLYKYGLLPSFNQNDLLQYLDQITHNQKYLIEYRHFLELRYEIKQILK
ncbi:unnamed protein product (macronuclear) [Paramecium tetraurelia]|uniref:Protein kinase domain-containing protein n=1 Tax=Paramecium tetraurelia TaxID=5888 RepID=A0DT58_PARTE|nr:uncharacterized protein GSPATT00019918001 [Paramecium tetraurelia]CAK86225.1 unnamed protein product [Paramecium tetraurelia]|eukprot:XP_001453622.1 hypothetical protein (macronuclear) [Paramecium tetraurelia strain d4-2]